MLPLTALIRAGLSDGMRSNSEPLAKSSYERIGAQANEIERQAGSRKKISRVLFEKSARGRIIRIPLSFLSLPFFLGSRQAGFEQKISFQTYVTVRLSLEI